MSEEDRELVLVATLRIETFGKRDQAVRRAERRLGALCTTHFKNARVLDVRTAEEYTVQQVCDLCGLSSVSSFSGPLVFGDDGVYHAVCRKQARYERGEPVPGFAPPEKT